MNPGIPSPPLRIGLLTPAWPGSRTANGIATAVAHLAAGLGACGHEVTIIPFSIDAPHDFPRIVRAPEQRWSLLDRLRMRLGLDPDGILHRGVGRRIATAAQEAIDRHGIEVLMMEETQGWATTVSRHVSIPVVVTLHGPWWLHKSFQSPGNTVMSDQREARESAGLRAASAIIAPSRDVLERTREKWGLPAVPSTVLHNSVSLNAKVPPFDPARLERILFVGRFELVKGGDVVIEAFERLARMHPVCRLTFAGPDVGIPSHDGRKILLSDIIAQLSAEVRNRIDVLGQCSREEVAALRRTHGLTIVASRYETFGGTIAEAMAAGSALVCTRVGGGAEILSDGETALLVPPENPQALAEACLRILGDPALARRLGEAARAYVENHLSPEAIGRQMADFLMPLCRGREG